VVETAPVDLTGLSATYLVADDRTGGVSQITAAAGSAPGTWVAHLPNPEPVELTLPRDGVPTVFAFPNAVLRVPAILLEHPDPAPAPEGAAITLIAPLDAATTASDQFDALVVGTWADRRFSADEAPAAITQLGPITYPYETSTHLGGQAELDAITTHDPFLVLRTSAGLLTGYAEATAFDQTGDDTVMTPMVTAPTMTGVPSDQPVDFTVDPPTVKSRFALALPPLTTGLATHWSVVAAPGYRYAEPAGPTLLSGDLADNDVGVSAVFGNPFADRAWNSMVVLQTSESRVFTLAAPAGSSDAPSPIVLSATMEQFVEPGTESVALDLPAGLPIAISFNGNSLSADGQTIAVPRQRVAIAVQTDTGNATLYGLEVSDLVFDGQAMTLVRQPVFRAMASAATFELPPEVFQAGHSYTIQASCMFGGYPGIATGDLVTRELPFARSSLDSAVFTVTP
jgi:hypothetical protein